MTDVPPIESQVRRSVGAGAEATAFGSVHWAERAGDPPKAEMTVGLAVFDAGRSNPRHLHPNCEEVVFVLEGRVTHTLGDEKTVLEAGDMIVIPRGLAHQVINEGAAAARCLIVFSSPDRQFREVE